MKAKFMLNVGLMVAICLLFCMCGGVMAQSPSMLPNLDIPEIPGHWKMSIGDAKKLMADHGFKAEERPLQNYIMVDVQNQGDTIYLGYMFENGKLKQAQRTMALKVADETEYDAATAAVEKDLAEKFKGAVKTITRDEKVDGDLKRNQQKYLTDDKELAFIMYKWSKDGTLKVLISFDNPNLLSVKEKWKLALDQLGFAVQN